MQVQRVIDELVNRGAADLAKNLRTVLDRLRQQPVRITVNDPTTGKAATIALGAFDIQWIVSHALGDSRLVRTLPAALREMAAGRFDQIAQIAMLRRTRTGVQSAMKAMMDQSSGASAERRRQIDDEAPRALLGNAINFPLFHLKHAWEPVKDLGESFRRPAGSTVPVLMLVGDLDPRTPVANATQIAVTLPQSQTVVVRNGNHDFDVFGSAAIRDAIATFLRGAPVPSEIVLPDLVFQ
jgi:pimeloyl-ACP methyl ester carboxylesterase